MNHVRSGLAALRSSSEDDTQRREPTGETPEPAHPEAAQEKSPSLPTASYMFSYLRSTADAAQKRISPALRELSKAEDVADAYLNKLGANVGQMLKDVVTIAPPEQSSKEIVNNSGIIFDSDIEKKGKNL